MSLMLKGIDLPTKKQKTLIVEIAWDGDVWVDNHDRYELKYNSAIQIPKGHGRIGDLDELAKHMKRNNPQTSKIKWMSIVTEGAPTILEAEE